MSLAIVINTLDFSLKSGDALLRILEAHEMTGILVLFLIVQYGGLLIASLVYVTASKPAIVYSLNSLQSVYISYLVDAVLIIILILILLNRHRKHKGALWNHRLFVTFEAVVLTATSAFAFLFLFTSLVVLPGTLAGEYIIIAFIAAVVLIIMREERHKVRNVATVVSSMGVGLVLGFNIGFYWAIAGLALFSVYDYLSVFVTKSMIKLAKILSNEDVAFFIDEEDIIAIPEEDIDKKEVEKYKAHLHYSHEDVNPLFKKALSSRELPIISSIELGEGDVGLPLMLVVSSYYAFSNIFFSLFLILGSTIGIITTMFFLKRYRVPLPAIPPLFAFMSIFVGLGFLITGISNLYTSILFILVGIFVIGFGMVYTLRRKGRDKKKKRGNRLPPLYVGLGL